MIGDGSEGLFAGNQVDMDRGVSGEIGGNGGRELVGFPYLLIPVD